MVKVVLVGGDEGLRRGLEIPFAGRPRLTVSRQGWRAVKRRPAALSEADLLVVDLTAPDAYASRGLASLIQANPHLPLVVRTDADLSRSVRLAQLLAAPTVDFVRPSADASEMGQRIRRLLERRAAPKAAPPAPRPIAKHLVPQLHDPGSGRLDARRVADLFGMKLTEVAQALGVPYPRLHKTPDAESVQEGLYLFERIALALITLVGSEEAARAWLHLPEEQVSNRTPVAALRDGDGGIIADILDDMMIGQPS